MAPFLVAIFLLGLSSLATAANFKQVFGWNELDYEWPSEASRTLALKNGTFKPENIDPRFMAVYGSRLFLSLNKDDGIPVTLVSMPTSSASSAAPKLTPFPSWEMNGHGDCSKIQQAKGLQVDSVGRLWMLHQGSDTCKSNLWIFNLKNNQTELIHPLSFPGWVQDLVIDETPNGTFAYITRWWFEKGFLVFSLEKNESWIVDMPEVDAYSIALSPKKLYFSAFSSRKLYSISVASIRNGTRTANPELIGNWTARSYRMLIDSHGTMYTAFTWKDYMSSWNSLQPFHEQRVYQVAGLDIVRPFTFSLDQNGNLWMTVFDNKRNPKYRLLKAAVGAKSPECGTSCHKNETAA
ncbi:protein yellow-like [Cloeon dipterum]|uniref:protein yellow-like n=1 Tax=Cloeon dipterum TaxID=197152 RepID=UPI00321FF568